MPAKAGIQVRSRLNYGKSCLRGNDAGTELGILVDVSRTPLIGAKGWSVSHATWLANTLSANSSLISSFLSVTPTSAA